MFCHNRPLCLRKLAQKFYLNWLQEINVDLKVVFWRWRRCCPQNDHWKLIRGLLECWELYYTLIILNFIDIHKWFSSLWRRAKTQNVTLESLSDGQLVKTWLTVDEDTLSFALQPCLLHKGSLAGHCGDIGLRKWRGTMLQKTPLGK